MMYAVIILVLALLAALYIFYRNRETLKEKDRAISLLNRKNNIYQQQISASTVNGMGSSSVEELVESLFGYINDEVGNCNRLSLLSLSGKTKLGRVIAVASENGTIHHDGEEHQVEQFSCWKHMTRNEHFVVNDLTSVTDLSETDKQQIKEGVQAYVSMPLKLNENLVGIINISASQKQLFTPSNLKTIEKITSPLAIMIDQLQSTENLNEKLAKMKRKNQKTWKMSLSIHKQKETIEEQLQTIRIEKEKIENDKVKMKEKNKKLWETSLSIHKEKEKVETVKRLIEEKNKDILDSITYAKRIQESILPKQEAITTKVPNHFILYKPRDIVSGDFYWFDDSNDQVLFAACDCTGHGVPGAFMSVVGNNALNHSVKELAITSPARILEAADDKIMEMLGQKEQTKGAMDGMDVALCNFNFADKELTYAGANRPCYVVRKGIKEIEEIEVYSGVRYGVGGEQDKRRSYDEHRVKMESGDMVYFFSDGYPDQFGGVKQKKYKTKNLKRFLISIHHEEMQKQRKELDKDITTWMGKINQIDDILLIGVRF